MTHPPAEDISGTTLADTPQGRVVVLSAPILVPVEEALTPRVVVEVLGGRPVPPGGGRTGYVKCPFQRALLAVFVEYVELGLRRDSPIFMAMRIELSRVFHGRFPLDGQRCVGRRRVHRLVGIWRDAGKDRPVRHPV